MTNLADAPEGFNGRRKKIPPGSQVKCDVHTEVFIIANKYSKQANPSETCVETCLAMTWPGLTNLTKSIPDENIPPGI